MFTKRILWLLIIILIPAAFAYYQPLDRLNKIHFKKRNINRPFYALYVSGKGKVIVAKGEERKILYPKGSYIKFYVDIVDLHLTVNADTVIVMTPEYQEIDYYRVDSNIVLLLADTLHIRRLNVETYGKAKVILFASPDVMMLQTYQKDNSIVKLPGTQIVGVNIVLSDKAVFDAIDCKIQTGITVSLDGQSTAKVYTDGIIQVTAKQGTRLIYKGKPYIDINGSPELRMIK